MRTLLCYGRGRFLRPRGSGQHSFTCRSVNAPKARIPSEQDVDRMFDYLEGMVRKSKERIERLDRPPMSPDSAVPGGEVPAEPEAGEKGEATPL